MQDDSDVRNIATSAEQPGKITRAVADLRAATHAALVQSRRSRLEIAQQTRQALKSHRAQIRGAVEGICLAAKRSIATGEPVVHRTDEWDIPDCEDQKWDFGFECETAVPITKQDMIKVIEQHPEGLSLTQIGNELGADWRGLVNWSHRLVIDGKVEKFDDLFYPARA